MNMEYEKWDKHQAAKAWGVCVDYALKLMPRCGLKLVDEHGRYKWFVLAGTPKPSQEKYGKYAKKKSKAFYAL
jgi:hypothetical protein